MGKTGVVDVGGGYRGVYAAGVLDYCMDNKIQFDIGIGVSAGSANLISYAAGQRGRNYKFYTEYGLRKEYAGVWNFIKSGSYINLDYIYGTLSNSDGEYPLDYDMIVRNPMQFYAVATEAETGNVTYFDEQDMKQDDYNIMKASSALPLACRPYRIGDSFYFDGALSDPIPIKKAFELGCEKVVLILTLPEDTVRTPDSDSRLARYIQRKYPRSAEKLRQKAALYNECIKLAKQYREEGRLLIIAPDDTCGVGTLCRDAAAMDKFYKKGYEDAKKIDRRSQT